MKRTLYLIASVLLGLLLQFLVHAGLEMAVIGSTLSDPNHWGFGWSWPTWLAVHRVASVVLALLGAVGGYCLGVIWWRVVYVDKRHPRLGDRARPEF
jgi:hypothetical protein